MAEYAGTPLASGCLLGMVLLRSQDFKSALIFMDPAWIALIGTVFGGVGLKAIEYLLSRDKVKMDEATRIREELREELAIIRTENRQLEKEVDEWREKYYDLRDKNIEREHGL